MYLISPLYLLRGEASEGRRRFCLTYSLLRAPAVRLLEKRYAAALGMSPI